MPIVNVFLNGTQRKNRGHLANIVKIAKSNGVLSVGEKKMLISVSKNLNIHKNILKRIVKNPEKYPMNPSVDYQERIERLYTLTKMLQVDQNGQNTTQLLNKISVGIGFTIGKHEHVVATAIDEIKKGSDIDTFTKAIKQANGVG